MSYCEVRTASLFLSVSLRCARIDVLPGSLGSGGWPVGTPRPASAAILVIGGKWGSQIP